MLPSNLSRFTRFGLLSLGTFFLTTLPHWAQAEAFKGGLVPSGIDKALFFICFIFGILLLGSFIALLVGIWEWLQTGKKDKLKAYLPKAFLALFMTIIIIFVLIMLLFLN